MDAEKRRYQVHIYGRIFIYLYKCVYIYENIIYSYIKKKAPDWAVMIKVSKVDAEKHRYQVPTYVCMYIFIYVYMCIHMKIYYTCMDV